MTWKIFKGGKKNRHVNVGQRGLAADMTWVYRPLPGAGAGQYAYETYGTPTYDFALGNGATFVRKPLKETQPAFWVNNQWPILSSSNLFQGQFATQPLLDPNTAVALGITVQDAIPPDSYNLLPAQGPVLGP